ncbi:uncharacterized protein TRAVEDRAFT_48422, partial [Trametes versicolor FP-101664 SS1]|uniref:uncharacterized protein n=1 Tax=Trametes versicolor (strain FP-101664) TaxID=717944 RepID=UPI00046217F9
MHDTDGRLHANGLRSDLILPQIPALHPDGLSRSLADANPHAVLLPSPLPHIPRHPPKPPPRKPSRRPSTASSAEDKYNILPPVQGMGDVSPSACSPLSDSSSYGGRAWSTSSRGHQSSVSAPIDDAALQEMNKRAHAAVAGLRAEASRLSGL